MSGAPWRGKWCVWMAVLASLLGAPSAFGQFGGRYSRPSTFITPVTQFGLIGGRYTGGWERGLGGQANRSQFARPVAGPLSVDLTARTIAPRTRASYAQAAQPLRSSLQGSAPATMRLLGVSLPSSVPPYVRQPLRARPLGGLTAESAREGYGGSLSVLGGSAGPFGYAGGFGVPPPGALEAASREEQAGSQADLPKSPPKALSDRTADKLQAAWARYLRQGHEALKAGDYRKAATWLSRARLIKPDKLEPILGLIVSRVGTGDYNQAAALVGLVARRWPGLLLEQQALIRLYGSQAAARAHLAALRGVVGEQRRSHNLRLVWRFYQWYLGSKQDAADYTRLLGNRLGPESAAAALAEAMQAALGRAGS